MNARVQNAVTGRLSLRPPQSVSLGKLVRALEAAPSLLGHDQDVASILATLKGEFSTLEDFEREFPSLCFSLATGVGKTRLMGAFIAYLHLAHGINNFFVLAPNLTIYNKLIADFTRNTPKYVFKGIAEFAQQPPLIITGDNYDQTGAVVQDQTAGFAHDVRINIFNISKINSEVRGGKEPRIKRMREVLGDSYFNHLANLPDLVLLMDESHRYRASAGVRSINELKPLFGLEVTATPFVESTKGPVAFKNVVMDYQLARAMEDGFVKEPAAVTQRNFNAKAHTPEEIERIKLEDGVRLHESTKVDLLTYARENGVKVVKPFMLVIARDTTHASQLKEILDFLGWDDVYEDQFAQDTRILLAAADFSKELTTAVMWLIDRGIDIRCIRMKPYRMADGTLLLDVQQLIPLPEATAFQTQIGVKKQAERQSRTDRHELRLKFWEGLLEAAKGKSDVHANRKPTSDGWLSGGINRLGFTLTYTTRRTDSQVELWIAHGTGQAVKNKAAFKALEVHKAGIEAEFGAALDWQELPEGEGCRIRYLIDGGYKSPLDQWPSIHANMVDAMIRLDKAMRPRVAQLNY